MSNYLKDNPLIILVSLATIGLWIGVVYNPDQTWLWVLAAVLTVVIIIGVNRNINGKDGLWDG